MIRKPRPSSRRIKAAAPAEGLLSCQQAPDYFRAYLEGNLDGSEEAAIRQHLEGCARCTNAIKDHRQLHALLAETIGSRGLNPNFDQRADQRLSERRRMAATHGTSAKAITGIQLGLAVDDREPEPARTADRGAAWAPRLGGRSP